VTPCGFPSLSIARPTCREHRVRPGVPSADEGAGDPKRERREPTADTAGPASGEPGPRACPQRRPADRFRQCDPGDPEGSHKGAPDPPQQRHHQGEGRGAAGLRRLAPLSAVHRPAVGILDRSHLRPCVRLHQEERDRHPPRHRRHRAGLHPPRDRDLHPALGRQRFLDDGDQAQGVREVRHRRGHPGVGERSADPELRRVLLLQRSRRAHQGGGHPLHPARSPRWRWPRWRATAT
jgi:hypothetical protein